MLSTKTATLATSSFSVGLFDMVSLDLFTTTHKSISAVPLLTL